MEFRERKASRKKNKEDENGKICDKLVVDAACAGLKFNNNNLFSSRQYREIKILFNDGVIVSLPLPLTWIFRIVPLIFN